MNTTHQNLVCWLTGWFLILAVSLNTGCSGTDTPSKPDSEVGNIVTAAYRYLDSSIPPKYHRSYRIEASVNGWVKATVDSYGEIIGEARHDLSPADWSRVLDAKKKIIGHARDEDNGCTGGWTDSVDFTMDDGTKFELFSYYCGGITFGTLGGDIEGYKALMKSLVPELDELLKK